MHSQVLPSCGVPSSPLPAASHQMTAPAVPIVTAPSSSSSPAAVSISGPTDIGITRACDLFELGFMCGKNFVDLLRNSVSDLARVSMDVLF
ncbi:hypothetical protein LWI28_027800 [Acer negundo]|uniref:Uncharacterized protein n=1 Tax=Acer negundo TaxID=4023 RepID=A0AAD5IW95_ACENE|nr:hypothetical protein LWI28_027800 [Acer negundo]